MSTTRVVKVFEGNDYTLPCYNYLHGGCVSGECPDGYLHVIFCAYCANNECKYGKKCIRPKAERIYGDFWRVKNGNHTYHILYSTMTESKTIKTPEKTPAKQNKPAVKTPAKESAKPATYTNAYASPNNVVTLDKINKTENPTNKAVSPAATKAGKAYAEAIANKQPVKVDVKNTAQNNDKQPVKVETKPKDVPERKSISVNLTQLKRGDAEKISDELFKHFNSRLEYCTRNLDSDYGYDELDILYTESTNLLELAASLYVFCGKFNESIDELNDIVEKREALLRQASAIKLKPDTTEKDAPKKNSA